jgi:hypothetical protein
MPMAVFVSMDYRFKKLVQYVRCWLNYFGISEYYRPTSELVHWLRRRLRLHAFLSRCFLAGEFDPSAADYETV